MNLFARDFSKPNNRAERDAIEADRLYRTEQHGPINTGKLQKWCNPDKSVRNFMWHFPTKFPNNFLNIYEYKDLDLNSEKEVFQSVVKSATKEHDVQEYIKLNQKWFIIATILFDYDFGHHEAYLFPEESLGGKYTPDYMILGKNSMGWNLLLIELEDVNVKFIHDNDNGLSQSVMKGLTQINDWKRWMNTNSINFLHALFSPRSVPDIPIDRIFYHLVVGTRESFNNNPESNNVRSQAIYQEQNLKISTYDRLIEYIPMIAERTTW